MMPQEIHWNIWEIPSPGKMGGSLRASQKQMVPRSPILTTAKETGLESRSGSRTEQRRRRPITGTEENCSGK